MENKKASISVGVMVIVTLLLFVFILVSLSFETNKLSTNFLAVSQLNQIYSEQQGYENTLHFRLVEVFLNSYQETLDESSVKIDGRSSFNIGESFRSKANNRFREFESDTPETLKALFIGVDPLIFDGKSIFVIVSPWKVERNLSFNSANNSRISYISSLNTSVGFGMFNLPSFEDLQVIYSQCISEDSELIESCFKTEFSRFNMDVSANLPNVDIVSRDKFYINHEMKFVKFKLLVELPSTTKS